MRALCGSEVNGLTSRNFTTVLTVDTDVYRQRQTCIMPLLDQIKVIQFIKSAAGQFRSFRWKIEAEKLNSASTFLSENSRQIFSFSTFWEEEKQPTNFFVFNFLGRSERRSRRRSFWRKAADNFFPSTFYPSHSASERIPLSMGIAPLGGYLDVAPQLPC